MHTERGSRESQRHAVREQHGGSRWRHAQRHGRSEVRRPAGDDYHLGVGSAAVDAGTNVGIPTDFDGEPRPQGVGFDIGYDEYTFLRLFLPRVMR